MADNTTDLKTRSEGLAHYTRLIVMLAAAVLLLVLLLERANRSHLNETAFITPYFLPVLIGCSLVSIVSAGLAIRGQIITWVRQYRLLTGLWLAGSLIGFILLLEIVPLLRIYTAPFLIWLLLFNMALIPLWLEPVLLTVNLEKRFRQIALLIIALVFPLLLLEITLRIWFTVFGSESDRVAYIYSVDDILERRNRYQGVAYMNYGLSTRFAGHNQRGYRDDPLIQPVPPDEYRIVTLGGSTTYGISLADDETYPETLERLLNQSTENKQIEVINAGVPAYSTFDSLANYIYRVQDDSPDMIIIYHAINDVLVRLVDPAVYSGLNPARGIWSPGRLSLSPFTLERVIKINLGLQSNPAQLNAVLPVEVNTCSEIDFCQDIGMTPQAILEANPPVYFERNLRTLITLAQMNDVRVVLSTWAYYPEAIPGGDFMTRSHLQYGVQQHNEIIRRLGDELNIPVIDLAESMPYNADFWLDGLHMSPSGTAEQAAQYAAFLVENDLLPQAD